MLQPNTYHAVLDTCPFIEQSLQRVREHRQEAVVFGLLEQPLVWEPTPHAN